MRRHYRRRWWHRLYPSDVVELAIATAFLLVAAAGVYQLDHRARNVRPASPAPPAIEQPAGDAEDPEPEPKENRARPPPRGPALVARV